MKYKVMVQGRSFEVNIDNLHTQPIIANVDGQILEVWVEHHNGIAQIKSQESAQNETASARPSPGRLPSMAELMKANNNDIVGDKKAICAPIPGTIVSVSAREGNEVSIGQELCVLEAMKMKNAIRSPRKGTIAAVHVSPGQTVQHHAVLVEFTD
jgi:biotin carboxyl carrier protein